MFLATPLPRSCGVYEITNLATGENYIGSSVNVRSRVNQHFGNTCLRRYIGINRFYDDIAKYGSDNFAAAPLEECSPENKIERERYWYERMRPTYNQITPCEQPFKDPVVRAKSNKACNTPQGRLNRLNAHRTESHGRKMRESKRNVMRPCEATLNEFSRQFESISEAGRWLVAEGKAKRQVIAVNHVKAVLDGARCTAYGYEWKEVPKCPD